MAADSVAMTTDCRDKRVRSVHTPFPNFLPLANTSFSLGRCKNHRTVFQVRVRWCRKRCEILLISLYHPLPSTRL